MFYLSRLWLVTMTVAVTTAAAAAQGASVSLHVSVVQSPGHNAEQHGAMPKVNEADPVIVWLVRLGPPDASVHRPEAAAQNFTLTQKNKQFSPHLLVIPTGASVDFPNLDPYFHNVFSLFNGRRFDLGLYEAGGRRSVRFDHDGVSYIFCNIHPEMGAVIVSLSTPWHSTSKPDGSVVLRNIPPGDYELNLWSQNVSPGDSLAARQRVHVGTQDIKLAPVVFTSRTVPIDHLNKFGEPYRKSDHTLY